MREAICYRTSGGMHCHLAPIHSSAVDVIAWRQQLCSGPDITFGQIAHCDRSVGVPAH